MESWAARAGRVAASLGFGLVSLLSSRYLGKLEALDLRGQGIEGPAIQAALESGLFGRLRRGTVTLWRTQR